MSGISEKTGYIRGMMDGLKLNKEDDVVMLLDKITEVLEDVAVSLNELHDDQQELNDYVESIDDDLAELEMRNDDDDFAPFGVDDDFDDDMEEDEPFARGHLRVLNRRDAVKEDHKAFSEEDEDDEVFVGCVCPECGRFFAVNNPDSYEDDQLFECPHCKAHVRVEPVDPESIPVAKPVK